MRYRQDGIHYQIIGDCMPHVDSVLKNGHAVLHLGKYRGWGVCLTL